LLLQLLPLLLLLLLLLLSLTRAAATSSAAGTKCTTDLLMKDQTLESDTAQQLLALPASRPAAVLWLISRTVCRNLTPIHSGCCDLRS
jgi:hypothetical protein